MGNMNIKKLEVELSKELTIQAIDRYSLRNKILILQQANYPLTDLKGYKTWLKDGFKPIKDHGLIICKPNKYLDRESGEYKLGGFKYITVWDRSQVVKA